VTDRKWLTRLSDPGISPTSRMMCLGPAGSGPSYFRPWPSFVPASVELYALSLPGRERRAREPLEPDLAVAIDSFVIAASGVCSDGLPFALYGHSMGARIAYQSGLELERRGLPPRAVVVSGHEPPHRRTNCLSHLSDDGLANILYRAGDRALSLNQELRDFYLPVLRNDMRAIDGHPVDSASRLSCTVVACALRDDSLVDSDAMREWERHTSAAFRYAQLEGGHVLTPTAMRLIAEIVTGALRGSGGVT
jgi:surfactin synthase thioesterase subunit